jgi:translation initiation factor 2 alpha subunit (eIF-2alpha)
MPKRINYKNKRYITDENIYSFMCGSLFEIQTGYENSYIFEKILSKDTYNELTDSIDFETIGFSKENFLNVLDDHIDNKVNKKKPELNETIKLKTYNPTGLADIKYSMDFKNFLEYEKLSKDFDIKINYVTGSVYSITLGQKEYELIGSNSITDAILIIKKEIASRALEKKIQNQIIM